MDKIEIPVGKYSVSVFIPAFCEGSFAIIYTHISNKDAEAVTKLQGNIKYILAAIDGVDWNSDLSPWHAPKAFRNSADFAGGADDYLKRLTKDIVPAVEEKLGIHLYSRTIAGYSLAGLFAIYALYRTDIFNRAASISGSLWYDGFLDFMAENRPVQTPQKVYFSLGDRESHAQNGRFANVGEYTAKAEKLLQNCGVTTKFELNKGNHFIDIPGRIAKGLNWITI